MVGRRGTLKYKKTHIIVEGLKLPTQKRGCHPFLVHTAAHPRQHLTLRGRLDDVFCFTFGASEQSLEAGITVPILR